jgi:hypothetical protein
VRDYLKVPPKNSIEVVVAICKRSPYAPESPLDFVATHRQGPIDHGCGA